jgi:hypothetical protein
MVAPTIVDSKATIATIIAVFIFGLNPASTRSSRLCWRSASG